MANLKPSTGGFIAKARLKRSGGSLLMTIPAAARNLLNLSDGDEMAVSVSDGKVVAEVIRPPADHPNVRRPRYTIEQLVEGYDADQPLSEDERTWLDAQPEGRETW